MESILKTVIKIAAVVLTAPATLAVASTLYVDFGPWRWVTAGAALVLVEGSLLLGWQLLDEKGKAATPGQRGLYAALVVVAYVVLWAIALVHGEGLAGIAFRATLGVLIVYSLAEAGILAGLRQDSAARRDIGSDRKVRRYQHKLAVNDAIAQLDADFGIKSKARFLTVQQAEARLEVENRQAMSIIGQLDSLDQPRSVGAGRQAVTNRSKKQRALDMIAAAQKVDPDLTKGQLAELSGVSRQTVSAWLSEKPGSNGNGSSGNGHGTSQ